MILEQAVNNRIIKKGTYDIGFNDGDETQFDAESFAELLELWIDFCEENGFNKNSVDYVEPAEV